MSLQRRTLQETTTAMSPADVLAAARSFFSRRHSIYAAYTEQESAHHLSLRGQGGEEIVIGVLPQGSGTRVTGSRPPRPSPTSRIADAKSRSGSV